jgi:hypothetical protein
MTGHAHPQSESRSQMEGFQAEGGLDPRSGWYITETVIYHQ